MKTTYSRYRIQRFMATRMGTDDLVNLCLRLEDKIGTRYRRNRTYINNHERLLTGIVDTAENNEEIGNLVFEISRFWIWDLGNNPSVLRSNEWRIDRELYSFKSEVLNGEKQFDSSKIDGIINQIEGTSGGQHIINNQQNGYGPQDQQRQGSATLIVPTSVFADKEFSFWLWIAPTEIKPTFSRMTEEVDFSGAGMILVETVVLLQFKSAVECVWECELDITAKELRFEKEIHSGKCLWQVTQDDKLEELPERHICFTAKTTSVGLNYIEIEICQSGRGIGSMIVAISVNDEFGNDEKEEITEGDGLAISSMDVYGDELNDLDDHSEIFTTKKIVASNLDDYFIADVAPNLLPKLHTVVANEDEDGGQLGVTLRRHEIQNFENRSGKHPGISLTGEVEFLAEDVYNINISFKQPRVFGSVFEFSSVDILHAYILDGRQGAWRNKGGYLTNDRKKEGFVNIEYRTNSENLEFLFLHDLFLRKSFTDKLRWKNVKLTNKENNLLIGNIGIESVVPIGQALRRLSGNPTVQLEHVESELVTAIGGYNQGDPADMSYERHPQFYEAPVLTQWPVHQRSRSKLGLPREFSGIPKEFQLRVLLQRDVRVCRRTLKVIDIEAADELHRLMRCRKEHYSDLGIGFDHLRSRLRSNLFSPYSSLVSPRKIKLKLGIHLIELREKSRKTGRLPELQQEFKACERRLKVIDIDDAYALSDLVEYYREHHQNLEIRVERCLTGVVSSRHRRKLLDGPAPGVTTWSETMLLCPRCSHELVDTRLCRCGADLTLLRLLNARADGLFNEALSSFRSGSIIRALECLEASALIVPLDMEARLFQSKLLALSGRWREFSRKVCDMQGMSPRHPEVQSLVQLMGEEKEGDDSDDGLQHTAHQQVYH